MSYILSRYKIVPNIIEIFIMNNSKSSKNSFDQILTKIVLNHTKMNNVKNQKYRKF